MINHEIYCGDRYDWNETKHLLEIRWEVINEVGSTDENILLWEQRIKDRIQSGMTIEEWCKKPWVLTGKI